jgi:golgi phosphoprotein 3
MPRRPQARPEDPRPLHLHEEILLLALHDEKGTFHSSMYSYALAGAVITELLLEGRLQVVHGRGKRRYLEVANPTPTGDPVLDHALHRVEGSGRREQVSRWVSRLATERRPSLAHRVAEDLVEAGVLDRHEGRILGIFRRIRFPAVSQDGRGQDPEEALAARLEAALRGDEEPEPRTAVVLALAHSAGILRHNVDRPPEGAEEAPGGAGADGREERPATPSRSPGGHDGRHGGGVGVGSGEGRT